MIRTGLAAVLIVTSTSGSCLCRPASPGFDCVRSVLAAEASREANVADVARRLSMSSRSLQRYLQQEGTTLQEGPASAARTWRVVAGRAARVDRQIAFVLGFSDVSTFHPGVQALDRSDAAARLSRAESPPAAD